MNYEAIIGLEVHAQLTTKSKIFCGCKTDFGAAPNTQVCPVCMGLPGSLPVLNRQAVNYAIKAGLATNCTIRRRGRFARKNYFYPDLPKGYQISQYDEPLCENGYVDIDLDGQSKRIGLIRIHLEEDAGKSMHPEGGGMDSSVDFNRCGVPLIEIVSRPDIRSPREAYAYLVRLKQILLYLGVCDGNMEQGSLRCDANISVRPQGQEEFGTRTEVKNMNSFRHVERALTFEIERQIDRVASGGEVEQQTLLWDAQRNVALPMRSKEESHDYRYFPDPDLVPMELSDDLITQIESDLPELPVARKTRFVEHYELPEYDANILTTTRELADYFEDVMTSHPDAKHAANWVMSDVLRVLNDRHLEIVDFPINPENLAELLNLVQDGTISSKIAKTVFDQMLDTGQSAPAIVKEKGLVQISDTSAIEVIVQQVIAANPEQAEQYRAGKTKVISFLMGQVMRETKGKANPGLVNKIFHDKLK